MIRTSLRLSSLPPVVLLLGGLSLGGGPALAQAEFDEAELFFELNATDGDVGLQGLVDGDAWRRVEITGPDGINRVIRAKTQPLVTFGLTELFFESNEPMLDERSFADLLALFPDGEYRFEGKTIENETIVGSTELTADLPCPAEILLPEDDGDGLTIEWQLEPGVFDPDTDICMDVDGGVEVVGVEIVVELENEELGLLRVFEVDMPPQATEVTVPAEFLEGADAEGTEAKVEVVVTEDSGNRTATEEDLEF